MKISLKIIFLFFSSVAIAQIDSNSVLGLPLVSSTTEMNSINGAQEGSIVYNESQKGIYIFNGTNWVSPSGSNWLITGNNGTTSSNFLGTTNDIKMQIRSNNLPLLEFGRRQTLGLVQNFPDYTDTNQPLIHLNGNGNVAALQFAASGASFYRPMFFTTANGSFRLKGSSGGTDLFEIGSAGPANDGRMEFIIGDDGNEPIVFKRYDYRNGRFHTELFRVQGSNGGANAKPRFGININPQQVSLDPTYNDTSSSGYNVANSTLQVGGSISTAILRTTSNISLNEDHHTVIITGTHNITLPAANSCSGRLYIIKNISGNNRTISTYKTLSNGNSTTVFNSTALWLQSDGTSWQRIN
ncbi:hypothetical protein SAMN04489761_0228 [Tenacibaculum sp. MAR_2009_124]|uniref:hypothetical protein n=1 Tax=Tenacibaculum sp. MAR_2009_124 TaxID=1250059 RepID=UPI00089CC203|nr:hypothetical protein [Tenacibaculum sp. MAR_2009_124]SEB37141.1 hypothetical protein SAMN04489761_0228 [Tenacibaculum sp. MAR_2009_124]